MVRLGRNQSAIFGCVVYCHSNRREPNHAATCGTNRKRGTSLKTLLMLVAIGALSQWAHGADANRLTYLDSFCDPYWPALDAAKLTTPQWIGEDQVECVVTIGIDDLRGDPTPFERYLRPILERLKQVDGRAPVSVMTNQIDPNHPQLQSWLEEGLSLETHTRDHPCPCLQGGSLSTAKETYDRCVDELASIPGSRPVAFRFPCMDSLNTPSPRGFTELVNSKTVKGNFLQISSSVCQLFTPEDPSLPKAIVLDEQGNDRFARYVPFESFVNKIENYPYPYVIDRLCWEFPCTVPDDWQGQNIQSDRNPQTAKDYLAAIDATFLKQGVANLVCHASDWIGSELMLRVVDTTLTKYGNRVKFLTFPECLARLNKNLLLGQPIRSSDGHDNGVRLLDLNDDGYMDVVIGNAQRRITRVWVPDQRTWQESAFPVPIVSTSDGMWRATGVRCGVLRVGGLPSVLVLNEDHRGIWHFDGRSWQRDDAMLAGLQVSGKPLMTAVEGRDRGVRLRDIDGDGRCEILVGNTTQREILEWNEERQTWESIGTLPEPIVDDQGRDAGLRFVDLNQDGRDDLVFSNEQRYAVLLYSAADRAWSKVAMRGNRSDSSVVPMISRLGTNNGAWFANGHMWVQNEDTTRMPNGVDRRKFTELLGNAAPEPRSPTDSLSSIRMRPGFEIELAAAEPQVMDPIAFDWGPDGRLWVVEMADYPLGLDDQGQPGGRIRVLEDVDGDRYYEKSTVFLDGIPFPTGLMVWRDGVLVSAAPDIFFASDTDGDGKADHHEVLYRGFVEGNQQHRVNGFAWGLDNWVHVANGDSGGKVRSLQTDAMLDIRGRDLRIRPDSGDMDLQTGFTQFWRRRDDWGNWFNSSNSQPLGHYVLADHYLRRNPHARYPSPAVSLAHTSNTEVFPISQVLSHFSGYKPPGTGESHRFTAASGTVVYRDDLFGSEYQSSTFTCEPVFNLVHRRQLVPDGVSFDSRRPSDEQGYEFLASTDSWFRPTSSRTGPDGALWIADMYRLVIEHPEWIDDEVEKSLFLRAGCDRGRIYRVYPSGANPRPIRKLDELSPVELVAALDSSNGWQRDTAHRLLVHSNDKSVIRPLHDLLRNASRPLARVHALCVLEGIDGLTEQCLLDALADEHPAVRRHALRVGEPLLIASSALARKAMELATDNDPMVRLQVAYSLGAADDPKTGSVLARLAIADDADEYVRAAAVSSLTADNLSAALEEVQQHVTEPDGQEFFGELMQIAAAVGSKQAIQDGMKLITQSEQDTAWQFDAASSLLIGCRDQAHPDSPLLLEVIAQLATLHSAATSIATDADSPLSLRLAAIRFLGPSNQWASEDELELWYELLDPVNEIEVQQAAAEALGWSKNPALATVLMESLPQQSPKMVAVALEVLVRRDQWVEKLLSRLEQDIKLRPTLNSTFRSRLLEHQDESIRARATELFATGESTREAVLEAYQQCLKSSGETSKGKLLFAKHCSQCHRLDGLGTEIGPDLAALKDRSRLAVLTAILDPNRAVEDKYRSYAVLTIDGRTISGMIESETSTAINLRTATGDRVVVLRTDIEALRSSFSFMPEGLERELNITDMTHLLSYIADLGPPRRSFAGNNPKQLQPDEGGVIRMTAADCRIYGETIAFEPRYGNLGMWQSQTDQAEWLIELSQTGTYEILMEYACDDSTAGNRYEMQVGDETLSGEIIGTGTWDDYQTKHLGQVTMKAGMIQVGFRPQEQPSQYLVDLKALILRPVSVE